MRKKEEIFEAIEKCEKERGFGMSKGPCPFSEDNKKGCCAECTMIYALYWVLGDEINPSKNGQDALIDAISGVSDFN